MSVIRTEVIRESAQLEALASEWWELWQRSPIATPFQSPAWLLAWWRAFAPGELRTVTARRCGRLMGIAPFYLEQSSQRLLPLGISSSDYIDILAEAESVGEVGTALLLRLLKEPGWERLELPELAPEAAALTLSDVVDYGVIRALGSSCPFLLLQAGLESSVRPGKLRDVRQARHRAARRGETVVVRADEKNWRRLFGELVRLHGDCWRTRGERGVLADPDVVRFQSEAIKGLIERRIARLCGLTIGGRMAAVYYGFHHRARAYAYLGGFDPAFGFESPGTLLMGDAIEAAIGDGARELSFLRGREPYKYTWGAVDRWNVNATVVRRQGHGYAA